MKIGIIVHSYTGNTLSVGERLKKVLEGAGHSVDLNKVTAFNEDPKYTGQVALKDKPDILEYDYVIFGAMVRAFSLSPIMKEYLIQIPTLKDKKVGCFVTQYFPFKWMGGNRTIKTIKKLCNDKDGTVVKDGIINWCKKDRDATIDQLIKDFSKV